LNRLNREVNCYNIGSNQKQDKSETVFQIEKCGQRKYVVFLVQA